MNRFVGWLGRRGAAASALGVAAALAGDALAESRKKDKNGGQREDRKAEDDSRERRASDEQDGRADRRNRSRDEDDRGGDRDDRRGSASAEQDADNDNNDDGEDAARQSTTPTPTPAAGVPTTPTPPVVGETNASIEDEQGNVIVGFDPESGSVVATSGNVTAISGPGGPTIIINDDEAVAPVPDEGVTPNPDGGNNDDPGFAS